MKHTKTLFALSLVTLISLTGCTLASEVSNNNQPTFNEADAGNDGGVPLATSIVPCDHDYYDKSGVHLHYAEFDLDGDTYLSATGVGASRMPTPRPDHELTIDYSNGDVRVLCGSTDLSNVYYTGYTEVRFIAVARSLYQ